MINEVQKIIERIESYREAHRTVPMTWEELDAIKKALNIREEEIEEQSIHDGELMMGIVKPKNKEEVLQKFFNNVCFALTLNGAFKPKYKQRLNIIEKQALECQKELGELK